MNDPIRISAKNLGALVLPFLTETVQWSLAGCRQYGDSQMTGSDRQLCERSGRQATTGSFLREPFNHARMPAPGLCSAFSWRICVSV